jgi:hypothetical protein
MKKTYNIKSGGFNAELQKAHRTPDTDWKFGAMSQPGLYSVPIEEREKFLPKGEVQRTDKDDMMDCASRAPVNKLETDFNYAYKNNLFKPENKSWLENHGYVQDGRVVFSDAFVAINSGTTRSGNSLKAPLEAIRKRGLVPKSMLPLLPDMSFEQYHDVKRITPELNKLGEAFIDRFQIQYEEVRAIHFKEANKDDMLVVAAFAWPEPKNGVYYRTDYDTNHAFITIKPQYFAFDNYEEKKDDFIKQLSSDYAFWDYGYRIYVSLERTASDIHAQYSVFEKILRYLSDLLKSIVEKDRKVVLPAPVVAPEPPDELITVNPSSPTVKQFAEAIKGFEGYYPPSPEYPNGSVSWRHNNPGNVKSIEGGFLWFETYEDGFAYLVSYINRVRMNRHAAYPKDCTILQYFHVYAPSSDNNHPDNYAGWVAKKIGVSTSFRVKDLV